MAFCSASQICDDGRCRTVRDGGHDDEHADGGGDDEHRDGGQALGGQPFTARARFTHRRTVDANPGESLRTQ